MHLVLKVLKIVFRGIQYMYCMMHKCITVKIWGEEKTCKLRKTQIEQKQGEFYEVWGKFRFF